ncbi:ANTAR domain-containing protein [Streptomyces sp. H27-D2]|uniref:ANTAR domain-containing protein n=1 Tax=Streptomyces sp. H27-D2 TaxID=3046304 RepID=UPI002DB854B4|nr:ANTAR domain-containing protein [Streptomyces sp. H27-D2]MEC4018651.1 ANTAR domain-containing protein [Streptomyces sp. H27-D2]
MAHVGAATAALEDLQCVLGLGPSADAAGRGAVGLVADLTDAESDRWPGLPSCVHALGVRAIFAFPLRIGAIPVGVLTGHRARPGPLPAQSLTDAFALADRLTMPLLAWASGADEPASLMGPASVLHRAELHQATGMVSVQLGIPLPQALLRLRGHAYRYRLPLLEVARAVVEGRLRLPAHPDDAATNGSWLAPDDPDRP